MTELWIAAALMTVGALAFLVVPLMRKSKADDASPARAEFDLTVYKDQLTEVDRDLDRGVLSEDQALAARTEIERRMLAAAQDKDQDKNTRRDMSGERTGNDSRNSSMALVAAILVVVPAGALSFYLYIGQPDLADQPLAQRQQQLADSAHAGSQADAQATEHDRDRARQLLAELEQRLEQNPEDIEGWLVLAQIYGAMNRHQDAADVYEKVIGLTDRHPDALTAMAESLIMAEDTVVIPAAVELLREVKAKDPSEPRSYFYLALERQQHSDLQGAMDEYIALLKASPSDAEWVGQIQERITGLASGMGIDVPVVKMLPPARALPTGPPPEMLQGSTSAPASAPGPTEEQMRDAQDMSAEDQKTMIAAMVQRLADKLKDNPDDLGGWQRLAQAYRVMGDAAGMAEAEANIKRLSGQ